MQRSSPLAQGCDLESNKDNHTDMSSSSDAASSRARAAATKPGGMPNAATDDCQALRAASLKCLTSLMPRDDRSKCEPFFEEYKACKKRAHEKKIAERIAKRGGSTW